jgi:quercetin dioxygenase-like cupin family protein
VCKAPLRPWLVLGVFGSALAGLTIQPDLRAAGDPVTFHDFNRLPWAQLAPGIAIKTVVGQAATFVIGEFEPGAATLSHHHTHEQANYGVTGDVVITIAGTPRLLGPDHATMALPDAEHFIRNNGSTTARLLEMQPVRRLDLLPPRPVLAFPRRPDAQPIPPGRTIASDFGNASTPWAVDGPERTATLKGDRVFLRVWDVRPGISNAVNLRPVANGAEQLSFLLRGAGVVTVNGHVTAVSAGTLIEMAPDATRVLFRTTSTTPSRIVEFHPLSVRDAPLSNN